MLLDATSTLTIGWPLTALSQGRSGRLELVIAASRSGAIFACACASEACAQAPGAIRHRTNEKSAARAMRSRSLRIEKRGSFRDRRSLQHIGLVHDITRAAEGLRPMHGRGCVSQHLVRALV